LIDGGGYKVKIKPINVLEGDEVVSRDEFKQILLKHRAMAVTKSLTRMGAK